MRAVPDLWQTRTVTGEIVAPPPSAGAADPLRIAGQAAQRISRRLLLPLGTDVAPGDAADAKGDRWKVDTVENVTFYLRCAVSRTER